MQYRIRRIWLTNLAEIEKEAKRTEIIVWPSKNLRVGGIYQLRSGKLYRVEERMEDRA